MKKKQVQEAIKLLSTHITQYPSNDGLAIAVLTAHIHELEEAINNAKNCLVCAAISDPGEVCITTLAMLEDIE